MPRPTYETEEVLGLEAAWTRLGQPAWEIVERRDDGRVVLGTPVLKSGRGLHGGGVAALLAGGEENVTGVRVYSPGDELAGGWWYATATEAREQFDKLIATYGQQRGGEERIFRVELLVNGERSDDRLIATGEVVAAPAVLDSVALTYLAAMLGVMTTFGFGVGSLASSLPFGLAAAFLSGVALIGVTRWARSRRTLLALAEYGLGVRSRDEGSA